MFLGFLTNFVNYYIIYTQFFIFSDLNLVFNLLFYSVPHIAYS